MSWEFCRIFWTTPPKKGFLRNWVGFPPASLADAYSVSRWSLKNMNIYYNTFWSELCILAPKCINDCKKWFWRAFKNQRVNQSNTTQLLLQLSNAPTHQTFLTSQVVCEWHLLYYINMQIGESWKLKVLRMWRKKSTWNWHAWPTDAENARLLLAVTEVHKNLWTRTSRAFVRSPTTEWSASYCL